MLIDTNVLIDVALDRRPHSITSMELLDKIEQTSTNAFVAWHTISTLYYIVDRETNDAVARTFIAKLIDFVEVAPAAADSLRYSLLLPMSDFEDAMQVAAARACGARYIITRNVRDFTCSPIPAVTPRQALRKLL